MKKLLLMILSVCMLFAFAACRESGEGPSVPSTDDRVYNNVADFSSQQGWNGWYYLYRDSMGEIYSMTFDLDTGRWNGRDFYCYNSIGEQHPGNNTETIIAWKATVNGTVSVSGSVVRNPVDWKGDGVFYYVTLNQTEDEDYLFSTVVEALNKDPYAIEFETQVKAGDILYFCINGNVNNSYDSTCSNITIQYKK